VTILERLQAWYASDCNGDWEHSWGIVIDTLDNPGWTVKIDLNGTELAEKAFDPVKIKQSEQDRIFATKAEGQFKIACGPGSLENAPGTFCDWAGF